MLSRSGSGFRYDLMLGRALRGLVHEALQQVAQNGSSLPGSHHFSLTFSTTHPKVVVPENLRERYPKEMTIILQHQFSDLKVEPDHFAVTLFFQSVPLRVVIPFEALVRFADPSVGFAIQMPSGIDNTAEDTCPKPPESADPTSGKVISLDQFRKKND